MNWMAIFNEVFSIGWLLAILVLLILIWRSLVAYLHVVRELATTLAGSAKSAAESARISAETGRILAAIVQNEQGR